MSRFAIREAKLSDAYFKSFGDRLPAALASEQHALEDRLASAD